MMKLDYEKIDDVVIENIDFSDYPDFCDAYVAKAMYDDDGSYRELTGEELDSLDSGWIQEQVYDRIY